jgi:hypothetical protein
MGELLGFSVINNLGLNKIAYWSLWLDCNNIKHWKKSFIKLYIYIYIYIEFYRNSSSRSHADVSGQKARMAVGQASMMKVKDGFHNYAEALRKVNYF